MTENGTKELEPPGPRPSLAKNHQEEKSSVIKEITKEFFDQSTIHGVKYIATRPLHEKVWWLTVCIVSIFICVFQIQALYSKWKETPVIITIDEKFTSIGETPFPAVTICGRFAIENETQFRYNWFMKEVLNKPFTDLESKYLDLFELASGMCFNTLKNRHKKNMSSFFKERNSSLQKIVEMLYKTNVGEHLKKCEGIESLGNWPCKRGFVKVLTKNGLCLSFNMVRKEELVRENVTLYLEDSFNDTFGWSPETGYVSKIPVIRIGEKPPFPHQIFTVGRKLQVSVKHYSSKNSCLNPMRVYIHHPHDFPWDAENSLLYPEASGMESIVVTPEMLMTPLHLRKSIPADRRSCLFDNERELMFFKIYSKSNCELECLTNITLNECQCVMFWMPHLNGTPICGIKQHKCYSLLAYRYLNVNIASTSADIINQYDIPYKCNCVQRCNSVTYTAEKKSSESQKNMINEDKEEDDEEDEEEDEKEDEEEDETEDEEEYDDYVEDNEEDNKEDKAKNYNKPISLGGDFQARVVPYPPPVVLNASKDQIIHSPKHIFKRSVALPTAFVDKKDSTYFKFQIEFQRAQILAYKRVAPYEISDFIANCGGLLGLFMGISVLSLVEILYFYTFRFVDAVRNVRKQGVPNGLEEK